MPVRPGTPQLRFLRPDDVAQMSATHTENTAVAYAARTGRRGTRETFYVAERNGELIGWVAVRHQLPNDPAANGGHIVCGVRPAHRRRGYATEMLHQALGVAAAMDHDRVLLTCAATNDAARHLIETSGGVADHGTLRAGTSNVLAYWVPTGSAAGAAPEVTRSVLLDGVEVAAPVADFGAPHWSFLGDLTSPAERPEVLERAAELVPHLTFDDPTLVVAAMHGELHVTDSMFSVMVARRELFRLADRDAATLAGVGSNAAVITADGWVGFAIRSPECGPFDAGKVVASVGEMASAEDVIAGRWLPGRTAARGLREELALRHGEVSLRPAGMAVLANGDVLASFVAYTMLRRDELEVVAATAPDAWERTEFLWCHISELAGFATGNEVWSTWGALSYALVCAHLGITVAPRSRIELG